MLLLWFSLNLVIMVFYRHNCPLTFDPESSPTCRGQKLSDIAKLVLLPSSKMVVEMQKKITEMVESPFEEGAPPYPDDGR